MTLTQFQIEALKRAVEQSHLSEITKGELLAVLGAARMTYMQACAILTPLRITLRKWDGEYRVNWRVVDGGTEETAYYTDDIEDAVETGKRRAERL